MLQQEWQKFKDHVRAEGRQEGHLEGLREGHLEGLREGHLEGLREGHLEGLRQAIESLCDVLDITLDDTRRHQLDGTDAPALNSLLNQLRKHRTWPDS